MPLSPADFYAYSQATGAPVADTPEKRAQQAPQVLAFQENRLKAPKQGPGLLDILGTAALGVGAVAGGIGLARALRGRGFGQAATKVAVEDLTPQAAQNVRRAAAAYTQPAPSAATYAEPVPSRVATAAPTIKETPLLPGTDKPNLGIQMVDIRELMSQAPSDTWHRQATQQSIANEASLIQNQHLLPPARTTAQLPHFASIDTGLPYSLKDIGELGLSHMEVAPELDTADRLLREYELGKQSRQASRIKAAQQDREMQLRGIGARIIDQLKGESLVDQQNSELAQHIDQSINAVNSSEDQMTGRVKHALQQNPHLDMSQVEVLEDIAENNYRQGMEQDEPINVAASQTIGHIPNDQAETPQASAQQFLQQRRSELAAQGMSPGRIERALMQGPEGTRIKQGAELYAATGAPETLGLLSQTPSQSLTVKPQTQVSVGKASTGELAEIPTQEFYKTFAARDPESGSLVYQDIYHTNRISNLGDKLATTPTHIDNPEYTKLIEDTNMAMYAAKQGDRQAGQIFNRNRALLRGELYRGGQQIQPPPAQVRNPEHIDLSQQIAEAHESRENVRQQMAARDLEAERFPGLMAVRQLQEGARPFAAVDPRTGEIIPGTLEVRAGRPSVPAGTVSKPASGSSMRGLHGIVETETTIPEERMQSSAAASELGQYGVFDPESGERIGLQQRVGMQPERREAVVQQPIIWDPNIHLLEQRTPEGFVYNQAAMRPPSQFVGREMARGAQKSSPEVARRSVDISEQLIRAQREGGAAKAQALLDSFKKGLI